MLTSTRPADASILRRLRTIALAGSLALAGGAWLGAAAGCSSTSSDSTEGVKTASADERAKNIPSYGDEFYKLGYRLEWRGFPTMMPGGTVKTFDAFGDSLAVMESNGVLTVLEPRSGQTRWSDQVAGRLTKFVGTLRDGDRLIVSSESEVFVYGIEAGALKARQRLSEVVSTKPAKVGEILAYGCVNGHVVGHVLTNGARLWGSGLTGSIETDPLPLEAGRAAYISTTGDLAILDIATGSSQARARMYGGTTVDMATSGSLIFVASTDQSLYAFSTAFLQPVWRNRTEAALKHPPVFHDGRLYCDMGADGLTAMDASTGKAIWKNPQVHGKVVAVRNKRVVAFDGSEAVLLDPAKGAVIERIAVPGTAIITTDKFADGNLYVVAAQGVVAKFVPR